MPDESVSVFEIVIRFASSGRSSPNRPQFAPLPRCDRTWRWWSGPQTCVPARLGSAALIGPKVGALAASDPRLAGLRLTVVGSTDQAYYAHLSRIVVRKAQHVRRDQLLGHSGTAGVPHLHIALKRGDPRRFCRATRIGGSC